MAKYAMLWTTSRGYMPGTNASLNAMELFGFKDVEVIVLTGGEFLPEEYKAAWPDVKFVDFMKFIVPPTGDYGWGYLYGDIVYAVENLRDYDAILFWGGDVCVAANFMEYFEICHKLDAMVLGTNEHGSHYLDSQTGMSQQWPYAHTWTVPYADVPFFVSKGTFPVLDLMIEYTKRPDNKLDRMDGMNYAVRDVKAKVVEVPGELWVCNVPYRRMLEMGRNREIFVSQSSSKMKAFHRRYWEADTCRIYLPGGTAESSPISRNNKLLFNKYYHFLNTQCRVKWTESVELWDGQ